MDVIYNTKGRKSRGTNPPIALLIKKLSERREVSMGESSDSNAVEGMAK
jgi:hypothetical protein